MADLLHEYWEGDGGGEFGPVREHNDLVRPTHLKNAQLRFAFRASSWFQAMQEYNQRLGYGLFQGEGDDHCYTDEERREQDEYLERRDV